MFLKISLYTFLLVLTLADKDDKKWVWNNNNRNSGRSGSSRFSDYPEREQASARYEIYENGGEPFNSFQENQFNEGPLNGNRPFGIPPTPLFRPEPQQIGPISNGPNKRPGGVYGENNYESGYGQGQGNYFPDDGQTSGILTGPVPSWEKQGPYKDFDHCKCSEKFNCNSPGISYGHCDVGKQYCCYSDSKKGHGGPLPSRPVHSIENGVLVGPGGPIDGLGRPYKGPGGPGFNNYNRPGLGSRPGGYIRPGQQGGFGIGGGGGALRPGFQGPNSYSPENGILVGPGGPYDRPNRGFENGFSPRSANAKNN